MSDYLDKLNKGLAPNPQDNCFADIWKEYERVILQSLVTSFGLDFIVRDQLGGDVDTLHNVREDGIFKNPLYAQKYENRGQYDQYAYHRDPNYRDMVANARKEFNQEGVQTPDRYFPDNLLVFNKGAGPWKRASLDHVVSAHEIHEDPARMLADLDGISLANNPENLRYTNISLNSKMQDKSIDEFIKWCEDNPDKVDWNGEKGAPLPEDVKERLREEDKRAREHYDAQIAKSYYSSPQFYADAAIAAGNRGLEMGARQAMGFVFLEIWFACKEKLNTVKPGSGFKECLTAISEGVPIGIDNARKKYKELIAQFEQGFVAGALASLTTTLCNIFFTTQKNVVRYIRQGYAAVVQAGEVLLINPEYLMIGDQLKKTTVILATGASVIAGCFVGDQIAKTPIGAAPHVGPAVTRFTSALVSGLLSCTLLILLDRSKLVNDLVGRMNQYTTEERSYLELSQAFETMAAELEEFDVMLFASECHQYNMTANMLNEAKSIEELSYHLDLLFKTLNIESPWDGDFDEFMSDRSNCLVFS